MKVYLHMYTYVKLHMYVRDLTFIYSSTQEVQLIIVIYEYFIQNTKIKIKYNR